MNKRMQDFGRLVKILGQLWGIDNLASAIGVDPERLQRIENGEEKVLDLNLLDRMGSVLKVDPKLLLYVQGERVPDLDASALARAEVFMAILSPVLDLGEEVMK